MAKKRKGLAARRIRKARSALEFVKNPPIAKDFVQKIGPGFAAYLATRLLARIVYTILAKKWPNGSKHVAAASSAIAFGGAWYAGHKIKALAPYHDALVVGAGIASGQTILQTYVPKYGWISGDYLPAPGGSAGAGAAAMPNGADATGEYEHDPDDLSYLAPGPSPQQQIAARPAASALQIRAPQTPDDTDDVVLEDLVIEPGVEDEDYSQMFN